MPTPGLRAFPSSANTRPPTGGFVDRTAGGDRTFPCDDTVRAEETTLALTTTYTLPRGAHRRLDAMVEGLIRNPGAMIKASEVEAFTRTSSFAPAFDKLPAAMSADDFIGALKLAMLTESATETYAVTIEERATTYDSPWLGRFIRDLWVPDEDLHHAPYRAMLMSAGIAEGELDREIADVRAKMLDYRSGDTPVHLTAYGMIQEYVTDNWHGLLGRSLRESVPAAAHLANRIKQRETLHTIWYRDMTALQVEANPRLLKHVAEAAAFFEMPGKSLVPHLEPNVPRWLDLLDNDFDRWAKEITRLLHQVCGDTKRSGELIVRVVEARGTKVGPLPPRLVRAVFDRLGPHGYGLLGEALLERAGLGYLFRDRRQTESGRAASLPSRLRGMVRRWVADQIDLGMRPTEHVEPEPAAPPAASAPASTVAARA